MMQFGREYALFEAAMSLNSLQHISSGINVGEQMTWRVSAV